MDDSDNMSADDSKSFDSSSTIKAKPKKRSLVERELETNLTARVTSPITAADRTSLSRYGRARRLKTETDSKKLGSPKITDRSPTMVQSPVYKMHASNSPIKSESPKKPDLYDNQIENIYQENISLSRFTTEEVVTSSPLKKQTKVYIQKDLIQRKDTDDPIMLIKNIFSPDNSSNKLNSHLSNILERSERFNMNMANQNGYALENSSVVKTLDFDSKKKKKENKDKVPSKNELFDLEAKCMFQVGDLAWARMGTYPFWPCIITRDPDSGMFVKKKLFGRVEHDIIHVTFFADNGRRSWIVDNMLRNYTGLAEFESTRDQFTVEDKKRDPRLYAAFFISEKKQALWRTSVDEAETLYREPKRIRIDMFNDMLERSRTLKTTPKLQKKITRTDSDVSLSESLYDSLFSEDDGKSDDTERSRNKSRNKSLDVSEVVTACLDNMAAKTGITKIQKQSHMDRWLQKAKSQTPEKVQVKTQVVKVIKINNNRKWKIIPKEMIKPYSLRRSGNESLTLLFNQNEHDYSKVLPDIIGDNKKDLTKIGTVSDNAVDKIGDKSLNNNSDKSTEQIKSLDIETNIKINDNEINNSEMNEHNLSIQTHENIVPNNVISEDSSNIRSKERIESLNGTVNSVPDCNIEGNLSSTLDTSSPVLNISDVEKQMELDSYTNQLQKDDVNTEIDTPQKPGVVTQIYQKPISPIVTKVPIDDVKHTTVVVSQKNNSSKEISINTINSHSNDNEMESVSVDNVGPKKASTDLQDIEYNLKTEISDVNNHVLETSSHNDDVADKNQKVVGMPIDDDQNVDENPISDLQFNKCDIDVSKQTCLSVKAINDSVEDTNKMEEEFNNLPLSKEPCDSDTMQGSENKIDTAKINFKLDKTDQSTTKIDSQYLSKIGSDMDVEDNEYDENKVTDEVELPKVITDKNKIDTETEVILDANTEVSTNNGPLLRENCENNCRTDSLKSSVANDSSGVDEVLENGTLMTTHEKVNHCSGATGQEEKETDSIEIPCEESNEAKVGIYNINKSNSICKVTEDNFLKNKSKVDSFIFLDNTPYNSINMSKHMNGHLENSNIKCDTFNMAIDIRETTKYNQKKLIKDNLKIMKLNDNEEDNDKVARKKYETEKVLTIEICDKTQTHHTEDAKLDNFKEKIAQNSLLISNTKCCGENNSSHDDSMERKENEDICYSLNSSNTSEKYVINAITPPLLDISIPGNFTQSPRTRSFLDNLNSLELAICNDIAKLGTLDSDPEKLSPTLCSPEINSKAIESKIEENGMLLEKEDLDRKKNTVQKSEIMIVDHLEEKSEIILQNGSKDNFGSLEENLSETFDSKTHQSSDKEEVSKCIDDNSDVKEDETILREGKLDSSTIKEEDKISAEPVNTNNLRDKVEANLDVNKNNHLNIHNEINHNKVNYDEKKTDSNMSDEPANVSEPIISKPVNEDIPELKIHNKLLESLKESHCIENGYHDSDSADLRDSDDDFDIDAVSVNSEDSVVSLNKTDKHYKRKLRVKADRPLEDPDFLKYLELRQDSLIDENPGLTDDEIIEYLYKTYLYEEDKKSDIQKTDDNETSNMVKGLNERVIKKNRVSRSVRDSLFQKKKNKIILRDYYEESDTASITSDSDVSWTDKRVNKSQLVVTMLDKVNCKGDRIMKITKVNKEVSNTIAKPSTVNETKQTLLTDYVSKTKKVNESPPKVAVSTSKSEEKNNDLKLECENVSTTSDETDVPLLFRKNRTKVKENEILGNITPQVIKQEPHKNSAEPEKNETTVIKRKKTKVEKRDTSFMDNPEFVQYLELRQDALIEENPQLSHDEIVYYLYKTWIYEEEKKSELKKADEIEQSGLVKGLNHVTDKKIKIKKKIPVDKEEEENNLVREKPRRKASKPFYNEEYSDLEDELEVFEIFKQKSSKQSVHDNNRVKTENEPFNSEVDPGGTKATEEWENEFDEVEYYFEQLTKPKPNIFKGLMRERVCDICELPNNLIKCKSCHGMFHITCVKKSVEVSKVNTPRRKKKKPGRKPKNLEDSESQGDEKCLDLSEEQNLSIDDNEFEPRVVDAEEFEKQLSVKMKEVLDNLEAINYDSYSSDDGIDWIDTVPGKCEIVDVKFKKRDKPIDYSDFKCNDCQKHDTPVCFVCKSATSKNGNEFRQKCNVAHCHKYYHLECLDHWPQSQFNSGEPSKNNKKINEHFEALTCPRHVCHTCVSDDPRGCKTRFSGDKLAKCVRCPATYHSFTKCVPAGTKVLTGSQVICPRHYELRPGKVPCHVNTGWCFICALGGTLICCEYCPTSFHAECLNIDPPEGGYMCEDCETGRLPLYGEMVWVKLGNYRWWPGLILHPSEIPDNLWSVRHSLGEFVVRFFGQYDYYWVNRGRVFPFQEGDSGRISSQKSKIDAAFTTAMEHAQRACELLKLAQPNEEESMDIASSLLPPHYVKLKTNKPIGSVCLKKLDDPELSLTQCECDPNEDEPCGPYSQCLNRVLLTECGPTCRAGDRCNNRAFEKRLYPKLTPYRTHHRGWGLKTLEDIKAGQFVIEYVGELIDEEEFQRRMRRKHEIRDENYYFLTLDKERMIDAGPKGNLARFMNHCCEPNCETQKWTVLGDVRVGLFAIHDIPANSEVTFNYNLQCAGIEKKRCLCGAKRCSGYMGAKPKQDESLSRKNKLQPKRTYKKRKVEISPATTKKQKRLGRPPKVKELTEIEKDLLIIKSATNLSSDDSDFVDKPKALKRKRVNFSSEEVSNSEESSKRSKTDVGD